MLSEPRRPGSVPSSTTVTPRRGDALADAPAERRAALAVEVALEAVADRLVQQHAGPARARARPSWCPRAPDAHSRLTSACVDRLLRRSRRSTLVGELARSRCGRRRPRCPARAGRSARRSPAPTGAPAAARRPRARRRSARPARPRIRRRGSPSPASTRGSSARHCCSSRSSSFTFSVSSSSDERVERRVERAAACRAAACDRLARCRPGARSRAWRLRRVLRARRS